MEDLVVVGAGFAGLACARSAAHRGLRVTVLERKPLFGARMHTTGILVKEAAEAWEVPPRVTRKIHGVRLYSPSLAHVDLESPGYYFLATETDALVRWFAREAQYAGARIVLRAPFRGAVRDGDAFTLVDIDLDCRYLVGADGPNSAVARAFDLGINSEFLVGAEWEMEGVRGVDPELLHCFLDAELAPGYLAWVVPGVRGITQVGLACRVPARADVEMLRAKLTGLFDFSAARVVERRSGLIPVGGRVSPFATAGVLLVGDAGGLVSPLTAGGIHAALDCGQRAGHAIADYLLDGGFAPDTVLASVFPRFATKRWLRRAFDAPMSNALLDAALGNTAFRAAAKWAFFHKRGPLSLAAWRDVAPRTHPPRPA
jgi:flavin-dependent dehydrogenase